MLQPFGRLALSLLFFRLLDAAPLDDTFNPMQAAFVSSSTEEENHLSGEELLERYAPVFKLS
jgi:hypothetical protein